VPGHIARVCLTEGILLPVLDILEIHNTVVIEVLARPYLVGDSIRVHIGQGVLIVVLPAEAEVKPADESHLVVDDNELLVIGPVKCHIGSILQHIIVRVAHDLDISEARRAFWAECLEGVLSVLQVARQGGLDLTVDDDVDLNASFGLAFKDLVEALLRVVIRRSAEKQL